MIRLENTDGSSNKFYELHLVKTKHRYTVTARYGAIGKTSRDTILYDGTDLKDAERAFEKKRDEKLKKGYVEVSD